MLFNVEEDKYMMNMKNHKNKPIKQIETNKHKQQANKHQGNT
jgi:hypothetical protein